MEEWHIPGKTASRQVPYKLKTRTIERLSARHQTVLATFLGFRKPLYSCIEGVCHSSTRPGTSYHVTQFYQAFSRVSTASDKRWSEKAWAWGYCLHAPPSKLIRMNPVSTRVQPTPWGVWVNRFTIRNRAFTWIRFRLIRILNRFKCPV